MTTVAKEEGKDEWGENDNNRHTDDDTPVGLPQVHHNGDDRHGDEAQQANDCDADGA